jgi:hypothetical protein
MATAQLFDAVRCTFFSDRIKTAENLRIKSSVVGFCAENLKVVRRSSNDDLMRQMLKTSHSVYIRAEYLSSFSMYIFFIFGLPQ